MLLLHGKLTTCDKFLKNKFIYFNYLSVHLLSRIEGGWNVTGVMLLANPEHSGCPTLQNNVLGAAGSSADCNTCSFASPGFVWY